MDLQTLKFFRAVAREGSFTAAGEKLGYAQSNLSSRIMQLEKECGTELLRRHKKGVTLTARGEQLLGYAERILNLSEDMEKAMRGSVVTAGSLNIGSMESYAVSVLPGILAKYHRQMPEVNLRVATGSTASLLKMLKNREADGVFVAGKITNPEFVSVPAGTENLVLISSAENTETERVSLKELLNERTMLVFPNGCSYRRTLENFAAEEGIVPGSIMEFSSLGAIIASVSAGLGVSLFPEAAVAGFAKRGEISVYRLPQKFSSAAISFVYLKESYMPEYFGKFVDVIRQK